MKSGGGVILTSGLQIVVGLILLGVYEGGKVRATRPAGRQERRDKDNKTLQRKTRLHRCGLGAQHNMAFCGVHQVAAPFARGLASASLLHAARVPLSARLFFPCACLPFISPPPTKARPLPPPQPFGGAQSASGSTLAGRGASSFLHCLNARSAASLPLRLPSCFLSVSSSMFSH